MPIMSFANADTLAVFEGRRVKGVSSDVAARAQAKPDMLDHAESLAILATPGAGH